MIETCKHSITHKWMFGKVTCTNDDRLRVRYHLYRYGGVQFVLLVGNAFTFSR